MTLSGKTACVFGGSGFIGRQIVRELARAGYVVKVASRVPERANSLKPSGSVGQIVPFLCNYQSDESLSRAVAGCQVVVNTVGIPYERGRKNSFQKIHAELPGRMATICREQKVERFIHISALGVYEATSRYARTKKAGEEAALKASNKTTILRPSVVFGPEDDFFNMFARLSSCLPALPLIGGGKTEFQPVYVGDVADAVMACLSRPETVGQAYDLAGPEIVTLKEIYQRLFEITGRKRVLVYMPWTVAKVQGALMNLMMPRPLLTADQVETLKTDNIKTTYISGKGLGDLGIEPTAMAVLPKYLSRFRAGGRFADRKSA